jgi:A/G-specific adenine glycosylase
MAVLREAEGDVAKTRLDLSWPHDPQQRERALDGLIADGLVEPLAGGSYRLPTS